MDDLGYIIGVLYGDGYLGCRKRNWKIGLNVIDLDFANVFKGALERWSGKKVCQYFLKSRVLNIKYKGKSYTGAPIIMTVLCSKKHALAISKFVNKKVNPILYSNEEKIAFIAGFADSEGTVHPGGNSYYIRLRKNLCSVCAAKETKKP